MSKHHLLTQEDVRALFEYRDGNLWWKNSGPGRYMDKPAGTTKGNTGYRAINIGKKLYYAHRLMWLYHYGEWPINDIDHIDGIKDNNRITNLREATSQQNKYNLGIRKTNTSGYKGVCWSKQAKKWRSEIRIDGVKTHLGYFDCPRDAHKAYCEAAQKYHGQFMNNGEK